MSLPLLCLQRAPAAPAAPAANASPRLVLLLLAVFLHHEDRVLALLHLDPSLLSDQLTFCGVAAATLAAPGLLLWAAHSAVISGGLSASRLGGLWSALSGGEPDASWGSGSGNSGTAAAPTSFVKLAYR